MDKTIKKLSKLIGVSVDDLKKAIEADDADSLIFDNLKVLKTDDLEIIKNNAKRDALADSKKEFLKELKEKSGIKKDFAEIPDFLENYKIGVLSDAKIEPDKKIVELTSQLETAQKAIEKEKKERLAAEQKAINTQRNLKIYNKLPKNIPGNLTQDEAVDVLLRGIETEYKDDKFYPLQNGKKLQDDKGNFIDFETFIEQKIKTKGWDLVADNNVGGGAGKGGSHMAGGGTTKVSGASDIKSLSQFVEYCDANNIKQHSKDGAMILQTAMQNKDFKNE
jgi:hypothetical protein